MNRRQFTAALPAAVLTTSTAANAQTYAKHHLGIDRFDHMSLNVANFDAAVAWYRDMLGLTVDVSWRVGALNGKQLAYLSLNGVRLLEIVAADPNGTGLKSPKTFGQHFGHTGYGHLCFATDNVDATMAALVARGVQAFVEAQTYPLDGTTFERRVAFITDPEQRHRVR